MPSISIRGLPDISTPPAHVAPSAELVAAVPFAARGKINYTTLTAKLTGEGIDAIREDGFASLVSWNAIIAIVARRLPPDAPFNGATFIDIVSDAGATLRILPWTRITGGLPLPEADLERARTFVQVVAAQALDAKLDAATKLFADSDGQAAQLPNAITLATHDQRFA